MLNQKLAHTRGLLHANPANDPQFLSLLFHYEKMRLDNEMDDNSAFLRERKTPVWFDDAKFGIFIHWSPAAIPAYAPLLPPEHVYAMRGAQNDADGLSKVWRRLPHAIAYENALRIEHSPTVRYHDEHFAGLTYDDFVDQFRDQMLPACDPEQWAKLAARAGAKYVVLVTKHQDGFLFWPSDVDNAYKSDWRSSRDIVGETATAVRARGMRFGTYYCGGADATFGNPPMRDHQTLIDAPPRTQEYLDYITAQWDEIIERYAPDIAWNDYAFPGPRDHLQRLLRRYFDRVPDGVVNNRFQEYAGTHLQPCPTYSDFTTPEYTAEGVPDIKWEACRSVGESFGYNALESGETYLSASDLVHTLADIVARGGNLLLNINPTATGTIPFAEAERLQAIGWWLEDHGEAIFHTRPWDRAVGVTLDGQGVRYTRAPAAVHAIILGTPPSAEVELDLFLDDGAEVRMPGHNAPLPWTRTPIGTRISLPQAPAKQPAMTFRLAPAEGVQPA